MKPSWDKAPDWANYLAQDFSGEWHWYEKKPVYNNYVYYWFYTSDGYGLRQKIQDLPNDNWKTTLEERPRAIVMPNAGLPDEKKCKQAIVVRSDLKMSVGKIAAQVAHASVKIFLDISNDTEFPEFTSSKMLYVPYAAGSAFDAWLNGEFTKIILQVDSEQALDEIYEKAKSAHLLSALIIDNGKTEFNGIKTKTCCAIGPAWADPIDRITGGLKLL